MLQTRNVQSHEDLHELLRKYEESLPNGQKVYLTVGIKSGKINEHLWVIRVTDHAHRLISIGGGFTIQDAWESQANCEWMHNTSE